ncbi:MAG: class II aldolase/adducin family protein [Lentisphaerae bacterium]|nr:class II aldolase/adducin family protein [Lentisphaerota bacterium]
MSFSYIHPKNILVQTLQRLYDLGMTTTSGGNLSIKDDDGNIWITPSGIDKGSLRPEDIVKVTPDGTVIGKHRPSCELPFHRSVYGLREDVRAVLHAHSPALVAFSLTGRIPDPTLIPGAAKVCGKVAFAKYEVPGSEKLGKIIAAEFANGADSVIMENHGAVMCGQSIAEAFARFESLDYVARIQINATSLGKEKPLIGKLPKPNYPEFIPNVISAKECELRDELAIFRARAYKQRLLFSGSAFLSSRLGDDDFLVTPANFEPMYLDSLGMVRMFNGMREAGKVPSSATAICRNIFNHCPWVNSVIMTRPPYLMAYAVTGVPIDSRVIPESYIMMRDIKVLSAEEYFKNPNAVVELLSPANPVILIENCGILTTGKSLLEAFDRLEVCEFTAKCLLLASKLGKFNPINQEQVDEIISEFNLPK